MEIYQLVHFVAIVETGSFTKGADRAAVSQSAISASVAKLEAEFGVQLLDRRRTPVVPTNAGERLLEAGRTILQICNTVKGELETIARPKLLRLGVLQSFSNHWIAGLMGAFRRINSDMAIEVSDAPSERLIEMLDERRLDAVLTILGDAPAKFPSVVFFKEPYMLAVPLDHRFAQQEIVAFSDLHGEPFIVRPGDDKFRDASTALMAHGIKIEVVFRTAQIDRTLALIAAGVGLSFIPARLGTPAMKLVQVADMDFSRSYGLLWSRERENDVKEFIKFAASYNWTR